MTKRTRFLALGLAFLGLMAVRPAGQVIGDSGQRPVRTLSADDIGDIATLLRLEDTRQFDEVELRRILASPHPEVRRRAVVSIGRIAKPEGSALLDIARKDEFYTIVATAAFAAGQLKDPAAVVWLDKMLTPETDTSIAREAAQALGKIRGPEARASLARYLNTVEESSKTRLVIGEALLSLGRFAPGEDLAPVLRWATSKDVEIRWRTAWALFRPKDPKALAPLMKLAADESPEVRFWAVRSLLPTLADQAGVARKDVATVLQAATKDRDRRVRTEALRALVQFDDDAGFGALVAALSSSDPWISTSAAEIANVNRFASRADELAPKLAAAVKTTKSEWLRTLSMQGLGRLGAAGTAQIEALNADPALKSLLPAPPAGRGAGAGGGGGGAQQPAPPVRTEADYRALVEKWIVPDYMGKAKPHAIWETPRGEIEIELNPGDAPMGTEYFLQSVTSGDIVGTAFTRVVPDFVAQQATIRNAPRLRDEVNRLGLLRTTLAWASSGLDTGRAGFTLASTPQPHNEGNFTALGRVVKGMDVVDALEQGDKILSARMK